MWTSLRTQSELSLGSGLASFASSNLPVVSFTLIGTACLDFGIDLPKNRVVQMLRSFSGSLASDFRSGSSMPLDHMPDWSSNQPSSKAPICEKSHCPRKPSAQQEDLPQVILSSQNILSP